MYEGENEESTKDIDKIQMRIEITAKSALGELDMCDNNFQHSCLTDVFLSGARIHRENMKTRERKANTQIYTQHRAYMYGVDYRWIDGAFDRNQKE